MTNIRVIIYRLINSIKLFTFVSLDQVYELHLGLSVDYSEELAFQRRLNTCYYVL